MKVIRLTESDLTRIVKRVINENSAKDNLIQMIKDDGWESAAELVGGSKNLKKLTDINTPVEFLHLFDDMDVVQSKENKGLTLFRYEPKKNIMVYDIKNGYVYISYDGFWSILEDNFGFNYNEIQELTKEWLSEVYNLRGVTTRRNYRFSRKTVV